MSVILSIRLEGKYYNEPEDDNKNDEPDEEIS